jgi:sterol desaturase/sphingolipid hydroxylase (fatty acid hydroxylase superfamily)
MSSLRSVARHVIFPATLLGALLVASGMLARGTAPEAVIVIWFGLMPFIAALERIMPRRPEWNRSHNDLLTDVIYFPTNLIVAGGLSALWAGIFLVMATELQSVVGSPVWPGDWPLFLQVMLACALAELFAYWPHRWMHENDFLWRFHSIHHSPKRVYWLNGVRAHPGEHIFRGFVSSIPLAVLGATPEVLAYVLVLSRVGGLYQHANIDFELGPFAWIFSIGELHRWHHSARKDEADHNFGDTYIIWDTVFGTRYLPQDKASPRDVGIKGLEAFPDGWLGQLAAPFRYPAIEAASHTLRHSKSRVREQAEMGDGPADD